jgi:DNA-binding PadR family transcriptional regulator
MEVILAREKFKTLTEQMFYILLCLQEECNGVDIMDKVSEMTGGRVQIGPGTLYSLLERFQEAYMIKQTKVEGRKRSYRITQNGQNALIEEYERLHKLIAAYDGYWQMRRDI